MRAQSHLSREPVVVIGGDAAGMSAASKIRREQPERPIVVFERTAHTSYSACGIPYYISGLVENADALVARSPETFRQKYAIDVRTNHEVTDVDIEGRRVRVRAPSGDAEFWEPYGELLIATGALPVWPDLPGGRANGIFGLSTLASGIAVHRYRHREPPRTAVIVGGGYIGDGRGTGRAVRLRLAGSSCSPAHQCLERAAPQLVPPA